MKDKKDERGFFPDVKNCERMECMCLRELDEPKYHGETKITHRCLNEHMSGTFGHYKSRRGGETVYECPHAIKYQEIRTRKME